jgi:hypothetical protein
MLAIHVTMTSMDPRLSIVGLKLIMPTIRPNHFRLMMRAMFSNPRLPMENGNQIDRHS